MTASDQSRSAPIGLYDRSGPEGQDYVAAGLSVAWLLLAGGWLLLWGDGGIDGVRFVLTLMVIFLPVAMIWVAATAMRATRIMRAESARLQAAVDALRHAYVTEAQKGRSDPQGGALGRKLDDIAAAQRRTEAAVARLSGAPMGSTGEERATATAAAPAPAGPDSLDQPALALGTPAEAMAPPLANADLIRALHFPETADDQEGFAALRRALKDRPSAQLVQAAQDVLTLLSQDGIYMDDLRPDMARPEVWRRFAKGARGREIAALGGVRDRSSLALTAARMKQDPIFRDAAHHFLRLFDRAVARFEPAATDAEISDLADTRSARAFMLIGRVAGTFN